jgi:putative hemolysin
MSEIGTEILIVSLLILLNGFFSLSEMAIVSARKMRLQQQAEDGKKGAQVALALSEEPTRFFSTVQVGITLIGIMSGALGGATIAEELAAGLSEIPWLVPYSEAIGVAVVVIFITYFSLVIGELVPKRIALNNAEGIAMRVAVPMNGLARLVTPLVSLLSTSTELVVRLLRIKPSTEPEFTEDEIKIMIYEGARAGIFEETEHEIMEHVFRLGDRKVSTIMTYRTEVVWLDVDDPLSENLQKMASAMYSRYPLCKGSPDNVQGVVHMKDIFAQAIQGQELDLNTVVRRALFVPESATALELLDQFQHKKEHIAFIVDEYGGMVGLVTINDIMEAIVGDIPTLDDEAEEPKIVQREDGSYLVDGMLSIEELKDLLRIYVLLDEDDAGYETLGGLLMSGLGRIPETGDVWQWEDVRFEVVDMDGYRVDKVLITVATV